MVIASNSQIECRHIIAIATVDNCAHVIYQDESWALKIYGGMMCKHCPECGIELPKEEKENG